MADPGLLLRRLMLRTNRTALRGFWRLLYETLMRAAAAYVRRALPGSSVYATGSVGSGEPVFGISDIDLLVVVPDGEGERAQALRARIRARFPRLGRTLGIRACEARDLAAASGGSCFVSRQAVLLGDRRVFDPTELIVRPGLRGPARTWRLVAGPELRPRSAPPEHADETIAGWLELQYWWRHAFSEAHGPSGLERAYICMRLVVEPARIWLALAHGERPQTRREILEATLRRLPEEEPALRRALALAEKPFSRDEDPLAVVQPFLVRQSARIARVVEQRAGTRETHVELAGAEAGAAALPLLDFRALVAGERPEELIVPQDGDPGDPVALATASAAESDDRLPVLRSGGVLVLPTALGWSRTILRAVQCGVSDPVSFALLDGAGVARFRQARGWSARDWAVRAVVEHRAWLAVTDDAPDTFWAGDQPSSRIASREGLGRLFSAARAGLFDETVRAGHPLLPLTIAEIARRLPGSVGEEARAAYDEGADVDQPLFDALAQLVRELPAYS